MPVPSDDPSEYWESDCSHERGILSLRHTGYPAGLGVIGKNTLLVNNRLGNMIQLGALLLSDEFEPIPRRNTMSAGMDATCVYRAVLSGH